MQIYGPSHLHGAQSISGPHNARVSQPQASSYTSAPADELSISDAASFVDQARNLPEMRMDRVQQLRSAIADGTYATDQKLNMALDRLLNEIA